MAFSMTGFGNATISDRRFQVKCDVQCVNKRNLEVNLSLPRSCISLEIPLRQMIELRLLRGKVSVVLDIQARTERRRMVLDEPLWSSLQESLNRMARKSSLPPESVPLSTWLGVEAIWKVEEARLTPEEIHPLLEKVLDKALGQLIRMRRTEGRRLTRDILACLEGLQAATGRIARRGPVVLQNYQKKIQKKVAGKGMFSPAEMDLFQRFVSIFSDKSDIREELTRLSSHCHQVGEYLRREGSVGRTLDFLLQECNREINTIGSKVGDLSVAQEVVQMKTLVEQMREQIQNLL